MGLQNTATTIAGVVGSVLIAMSEEHQVLFIIITGFVILTIQLGWPEYEYREQLYNPDLEPEKVSQWEKFKEGFLEMGWKVRKVRRRKQ